MPHCHAFEILLSAHPFPCVVRLDAQAAQASRDGSFHVLFSCSFHASMLMFFFLVRVFTSHLLTLSSCDHIPPVDLALMCSHPTC